MKVNIEKFIYDKGYHEGAADVLEILKTLFSDKESLDKIKIVEDSVKDSNPKS